MARNVGVSIENAFNKGLVTEVTGVNSPENSVLDTMNVLYDRRGRAIKRKGFGYETGHQFEEIGASGVFTEYLWHTVASNEAEDFVVLQIGSTLYFYSVEQDSSLSRNLKSFNVSLLPYKTTAFSNSQVAATPVSYSTGRGYLFVAHPYCDTIYIKYNPDSDSVTTKRISIKIRDLEGVEDSLEVDQRPTSITAAHKYNLYNQGWYATVYVGGGTFRNAFDHWAATRPDYPSNVDVWWYYAAITQDATAREFLSMQTVDARTSLYGNTPAPKGHYIINAFSSNRSTLSGISGVTLTTSNGLRPSVVAFYAGRAFYGGVGVSGFSSLIYFSQIIERDDQLEKCYQANDPTSREIADLLDSDGGVIDIQDINTVHDLRVVGDALYVFASNGIWAISGTDNGPFRATDYSVTKITSESAISRSCIVEVSGSPIWWNHEGIFTLKKSEIGLTTDVTNLTATTIQSFYDEIPQSVKTAVKGAYNNQSNLVYWLYSSDPVAPTIFDRILILDALTLAFYVYSLPMSSPQRIKGLVAVRSAGNLFTTENVITDLEDEVVTNLGDQIIVSLDVGVFANQMEFKFLTTLGTSVTFSQIHLPSYLDWDTDDYSSYFKTGYRVRGELIKKTQTNYLTVLMEQVENSSVLVQPIWEYANTPDSGRYGNPQQAYRYRMADYSLARLKIRGTGHAVLFHFFGQTGQPFSIIGWAGYETSNGAP